MSKTQFDGQMDFLNLLSEYTDDQGATVRVKDPSVRKAKPKLVFEDLDQLSFEDLSTDEPESSEVTKAELKKAPLEVTKTEPAAKEVKKANLSTLTEKTWISLSSSTINPTDDGALKLKALVGDDSNTFKYLYPGEGVTPLTFNGTEYNHNNVDIDIYVISGSFGYYKTRVTVHYYNGEREVSYNGTHFSE